MSIRLSIEGLREQDEQLRREGVEILGYDPRERRPEFHHETVERDPTQRNARALVVDLLRQRDGDRCYLCREPFGERQPCVEHVIPIGLGGENTAENVALACYPCNARKGDMIVSIDVSSGAPCYHRLRSTWERR